MKKIILILLLLMNNNICLISQSEIKLTAAATHTFSLCDVGVVGWNNYFENQYMGTNLSIGGELATKKGNVSCSAIYQYGGGWYNKLYEFDYHMLGGGVKYRLLNDNKIVSPLFGMMLLTEIASDYRGKYLLYYRPVDYFSSLYDTRYYVSTPILGNITIGCDFRLTRGLHINIGFGYGYRFIKTRYDKWAFIESEMSMKKYSVEENKQFHFLDVQVGLSYSFPLKKKE